MSDWIVPIPYALIPTKLSESFRSMVDGVTALPLPPHPAAYAVQRTNHIHEGIDLYCDNGTPVYPVEKGTIKAILPFTGSIAGSPWWYDTMAVLVEGKTGVVVYGEINPSNNLVVGQLLDTDDLVGNVKQVLKVDKGRPLSMLHLELHFHGTNDVEEWLLMDKKPKTLRDPTNYLLEARPRL